MRTAKQAIAASLTITTLIAGVHIAAQERSAPPADRTVVHVLNRLGFGPTSDTMERVRRMGIAAYVDEQLHPDRLADAALLPKIAALTTLTKSSRELAEEYFLPAQRLRREQQRTRSEMAIRRGMEKTEPPVAEPRAGDLRLQRLPLAELMQQKVLRAAASERQLQEVLVDFWFNHFNVFAGKGQVRTYIAEYERDAIRPHVLGRFRDLLGATARSPAMLFYLDNWQSAAAPVPAKRGAQSQGRRRGINENYARELLELHTLGVDGGYTQKDVQEVARAFTGWTIDNPRQGGPFRFEPRLHDEGEKVVLGHRIAPGGGQRDGKQVLDILARHPSTARFVATKLARRFVSDDPPPPLVARAAAEFTRTDGSIRETVRAVLTSAEFTAAAAWRAKTKTPFEYVVSAVRALDREIQPERLVQAVRELGMPLYGAQAPTGYADRAEAWVNSGALLNRMNFALALAGSNGDTGRTDGRRRRLAPAAADPSAAELMTVALAGDISAATATTIARAATPAQAVALTLGSPEFQKR